MNEAIGPVMIVLGLVLLGWIGSGASLTLGSTALQEKAGRGGIIWALPLGILFALSFCPVSAGLFFGGLLPLALQQQSVLVLPVVYGIGTSLPVVVFAFIMAFASAYVGRAFNQLTRIERWVRYLTGTVFIIAGIYYTLTHIYGVVF
jgi:cytochrome c biogenesis protein CcdA